MRVFVKHILKILLILVTSAYILDYSFTYIYGNVVAQNKVQYINSLKNEKVDYIFLGSSRVENSIISDQIEKKTNKRTINLGIKGLKLKDIYYILRLLQENNISCEKVFIQIDYSFNYEEEFSKFFNLELQPLYNSSNKVIDEYLKNSNENYIFNKYIPFIRYTNSDQLIGFRKIVASLKIKPSVLIMNKGYEPLYGFLDRKLEKIPNTVKKSNKYFSKINSLVKSKNISVVYFSAPVSTNSENLEYFIGLKENIPELYNFHNVLTEEKYFYDKLHVNHEGAVFFTNILIEKLNL